MDLATYRELLTHARRLTRELADAEDLVQEVLVIALTAGRHEPAWLAGVLRRQAALQVRTVVRRRRRETVYDSTQASTTGASSEVEGERLVVGAPEGATAALTAAPELLARLPPAGRRVAVLALHGLGAAEIRWILGLSETAFRQRLTSIRKVLGTLPAQLRGEALALAYVRDPQRSTELAFGLVRRALAAALEVRSGLGTHDPDGHLIVIGDGVSRRSRPTVTDDAESIIVPSTNSDPVLTKPGGTATKG